MDLTEHLPEGAVPIGYVASIKYLDTDGSICTRHTMQGLNPWDAMHMNIAAVQDMRADMHTGEN